MGIKFLTRLAFTALALCLVTGCASKMRVPLGQIPKAEAPAKGDLESSKSYLIDYSDEAGHTLIQKGPEYQRVKKIVARLESAAGLKSDSFPVYVMDVPGEANAMALNGNTMVAYKKLVNDLKSDDALATIMGHEMAHIICGHAQDDSAEERSSSLEVGSIILGTIASVAVSVAGGGSGLADLTGDLTETSTNLIGTGTLVRAYDRELEYEADQVGLMLMAKAGYDPKVGIEFWASAEGMFGEHDFAFLSTHPAHADRAEYLNEALPHAEKYRNDFFAQNPPVKKGASAKKGKAA